MIKAKINEQAVQASTYQDLVAQCHRIEENERLFCGGNRNKDYRVRDSRNTHNRLASSVTASNNNQSRRQDSRKRSPRRNQENRSGNRGSRRNNGGNRGVRQGYHRARGNRSSKPHISEFEKQCRRDKNLCFHCGKEEHISRACPQRQNPLPNSNASSHANANTNATNQSKN